MDFSVNKPAKDFLKLYFEDWYAEWLPAWWTRIRVTDLEPILTLCKLFKTASNENCFLKLHKMEDDSEDNFDIISCGDDNVNNMYIKELKLIIHTMAVTKNI